MKENDQEIQGHEYDGIKEFDNPLPNWWLVTFFGTIIFAFIYYVHYEIGGGPTLADELKLAMEQMKSAATQAAPTNEPAENEELLATLAQDQGAMKKGEEVYKGKCAACHGPELQGQIGPNLTDKFWIHGPPTRENILKVVRKGVADKGMPPWEAILSKTESQSVSSFLFTKIGSNPANPKAPQGTEYK